MSGQMKASAIIAVLAWMLFLAVTFFVALGEIQFGSRQHVYSSAVFVFVGIIAGIMNLGQSASGQTAAQKTR